MQRSVRKQFSQSPTPLDTPDLLQVMASAPAPMACADASGRLQWCNDAFAALLTPAIAMGDDLPNRLGPHWAALWGPGWTPTAPGNHQRWRIVASAGSAGVVLSGQPLPDHEALELRLDELRGELDAALALARIGVWRHEIETGRVYLDERCSELMGVPLQREGITLQEAREHIHPDDRDLVIEATERTLRTGLPSDVELRYPQGDGSMRFVISRRALQHDADGRPLRFFGVMLDITEHQLAVQRLRDTVERMTLASRAIGIGAWEADERVNEVHWDDQMFRLRGVDSPGRTVTTDEIAGYIHPDDRAAVIAEQADRLLAGATWQQEFRVLWPDGTVRWITSHSAPVVD